MLWKHTDWRTDEVEVRRSRRLTASFVSTVGNYEYGFYWHFYQDASLELEVKLTGIVNTVGKGSVFATEVAPQLFAPNHQVFDLAPPRPRLIPPHLASSRRISPHSRVTSRSTSSMCASTCGSTATKATP